MTATDDVTLDLAPLARAWVQARESGHHAGSEALLDAVMLLTSLTHDEVWDLLTESIHQPTVRFVPAPF